MGKRQGKKKGQKAVFVLYFQCFTGQGLPETEVVAQYLVTLGGFSFQEYVGTFTTMVNFSTSSFLQQYVSHVYKELLQFACFELNVWQNHLMTLSLCARIWSLFTSSLSLSLCATSSPAWRVLVCFIVSCTDGIHTFDQQCCPCLYLFQFYSIWNRKTRNVQSIEDASTP